MMNSQKVINETTMWCSSRTARGILEFKFDHLWIVPIHSRLQGGVFSAPAGKKAPDAKHANAWLSSARRELKIKLSVIDRFIFFFVSFLVAMKRNIADGLFAKSSNLSIDECLIHYLFDVQFFTKVINKVTDNDTIKQI